MRIHKCTYVYIYIHMYIYIHRYIFPQLLSDRLSLHKFHLRCHSGMGMRLLLVMNVCCTDHGQTNNSNTAGNTGMGCTAGPRSFWGSTCYRSVDQNPMLVTMWTLSLCSAHSAFAIPKASRSCIANTWSLKVLPYNSLGAPSTYHQVRWSLGGSFSICMVLAGN